MRDLRIPKQGLLIAGVLACGLSVASSDALAQSVTFEWANVYHGMDGASRSNSGDVYMPKTIFVDGAGNVYNIGNFRGTVDFGAGTGVDTLNSLGGQERFITKSDNDGNLIWAKRFGNAGSFNKPTAVATDSLNNIYVGGYFQDTFDLNPDPIVEDLAVSTGGGDIFIVKLDSAGNYVWGKQIGGSSSDDLNGMAVDAAGNIYATGYSSGNVDFDPGTGYHWLPSGGRGYLLALNADGDFRWAHKLMKSGSSDGFGVALDGRGHVYVVGDFSGTNMDFEPDTTATFIMSSAGSKDIFVAKYDTTGDFIWATRQGGTKQDQGYSIDVDSIGNVYTTGVFGDTADFDPGAGTHNLINRGGTWEVFVSALDPDGNFRWARQLDGKGTNSGGWSLALGHGKHEGIYATGSYRDSTYFYAGQDTLLFTVEEGSGNGYIIKLDTAGTFEWSRYITANMMGSIAVDQQGGIFSAGYFNKPTVDFNPGANPHLVNLSGVSEGFIIKLQSCLLIDTLRETTCNSFEFEGTTYTSTGMYEVVNPEGCDSNSVLILDLTINNPDPVITVDGYTLGTVRTYATYQWLFNGQEINGATDSSYTVTENGDYQVVVTGEQGCTDTSDVYAVNNVSIDDLAGIEKMIRVYPNPTTNYLQISSPVRVDIVLTGLDGKVILAQENARQLSLQELPNGIYFLSIMDQENHLIKVEKVVLSK